MRNIYLSVGDAVTPLREMPRARRLKKNTFDIVMKAIDGDMSQFW